MKRGGMAIVNGKAAQIVRVGGLVTPIVLMLYGLVLKSIGTSDVADTVMLLVFSGGWIALGYYQFVNRSASKLVNGILLALYHLFSVLYLVNISGFSTPISSGWIILLLATFLYFGRKGMRISALVFLATCLIDSFLHSDNLERITSNLIYLTLTLVIGMIAVEISNYHQIDHRELTRTKEKEQLQRDRIMTIVNNLADAILSTDKNGVVQVYNAASLGLLDTNLNLHGKKLDDIITLRDGGGAPFTFSSAFRETRGVTSRDDLSAEISQELLHLSVIYSPIRGTNSGQSSSTSNDGYIVILRDITKQKSLEEERDEFISVVSHELRTPLTIAEGSLSNVQYMMRQPNVPQATLQKSVDMAHEQTIFLARMVNDLSTLSRAERGVADDPEVIDVTTLTHEVYHEYAPQAHDKGLGFDLDLDPGVGTVTTSRLYLKELIQNFVTNAIKYTKEGSILLSVKSDDATIHFSVKDSGIGISKHDQARIFDKFYRSEDYRTRETGGTGLGLYVANKLARKLDTVIELKSRLNHGSTFGFTVPKTPNTSEPK